MLCCSTLEGTLNGRGIKNQINCFELSKIVNHIFQGNKYEAVDSFQIALDALACSHGSDHT